MQPTNERIGDYLVGERLGAGGVGTVFAGTHKDRLDERVAIKILHEQFNEESKIAARFRREEAAIRAISHDNVVKVFDYLQLPDSRAAIIMEYISGEPLGTFMRQQPEGKLEPLIACQIFAQIADGMSAAHKRQIFHRDLKPNNVMLLDEPKQPGGLLVKIVDFGIAKAGGPDFTQIHTEDGNIIMGTPAYMSPEQFIRPGKVDGQADVYSLGVMLYKALSGHLPFSFNGQGNAIVECLQYREMHSSAPLPPLPSGIPAPLIHLAQHMLAKKPASRPRMTGVRDELRKIATQLGRPQHADANRPPPEDAATVPIVALETVRIQTTQPKTLWRQSPRVLLVALLVLSAWAIVSTAMLLLRR